MKKNLGIFDHFDFLKQQYPCVLDGCFAFVKDSGTVYLHINNAWKNTNLPITHYEFLVKADDLTPDPIIDEKPKFETVVEESSEATNKLVEEEAIETETSEEPELEIKLTEKE